MPLRHRNWINRSVTKDFVERSNRIHRKACRWAPAPISGDKKVVRLLLSFARARCFARVAWVREAASGLVLSRKAGSARLRRGDRVPVSRWREGFRGPSLFVSIPFLSLVQSGIVDASIGRR